MPIQKESLAVRLSWSSNLQALNQSMTVSSM